MGVGWEGGGRPSDRPLGATEQAGNRRPARSNATGRHWTAFLVQRPPLVSLAVRSHSSRDEASTVRRVASLSPRLCSGSPTPVPSMPRTLRQLSFDALSTLIATAISATTGSPHRADVLSLSTMSPSSHEHEEVFELRVRLEAGPSERAVPVLPQNAHLQQTQLDRASAEADTSSAQQAAAIPATSGRRLNASWGVNARHALFHRHGRWYHKLRRFPGALFDRRGYVLFATRDAFESSPHLRITQDVHVPGGISTIPEYVRVYGD